MKKLHGEIMNNLIGTLIRCGDVTEERIAFYQQIGLNALQLAGVYDEYLADTADARAKSDALFALFEKYSLKVPGLFLSYTNQNWRDITNTIGITPGSFRCTRMIASCRQMVWAKRYGIKYISCHIGELPAEDSENYKKFAAEFKELVKFASELDLEFLLETGMEDADGLEKFFAEVNEPTLGLNLDPANLIYYNCDKPLNVLQRHRSAVKVVHCKDAVPGAETVLGQGAVDFEGFLQDVIKNGFTGPLIIERELPFGPEQENDVKNAVKYINSIIKGAEK